MPDSNPGKTRWSERISSWHPIERFGKMRDGAAGSIVSVIAGVLFLVIPLSGRNLANWSYDLSFFFRRDIPVEGVTIISMDLESHALLGQNKFETWSRTLHAQLIRQMAQSGAKAVVFDVVFLPFTNSPAGDAELVEAAAQYGKVVVGASDEPEIFEGKIINERLVAPFPALERVTKWGLVATSTEDEFVRRHRARMDLSEPAPSLAWRAAEVAWERPPALDPFRDRWMNYYGPAGMFPYMKYSQALAATNAGDSMLFSNQVIFVGTRLNLGPTGGKESDDFRTPYSRWGRGRTPGVEINATAYLNLVRNEALVRTSGLMEFALLLLFGTLFGWGLAWFRPVLAVGAGGLVGAALWGVAHVIVWQTHVWFPWLAVSAVQVPVAASWSILAHTRRLVREKQALETSLAASDAEPNGSPLMGAARSPRPGSGPAGDAAGSAENVTQLPTVQQASESLMVPDYTLIRAIGKGAFGEVYLGMDIIGSYHAVKIVHRRYFREGGPYEREFNGIKRFTPIANGHPGLVSVQHVGRNDQAGYIYYVMELADDESRGATIHPDSYRPRNLASDLKLRGALPLAECLKIGVEIADALDYLHRQRLIHRDIKPANIIFVRGRAKLADIGLVTETAGEDHSVSFLGTRGYIPPEGPGSPQADLYSLGKVIYQMATGFPVTRYPDPPSAVMEAREGDAYLELNGIILTACDQLPEQRFASAAALRDSLAAINPKS